VEKGEEREEKRTKKVSFCIFSILPGNSFAYKLRFLELVGHSFIFLMAPPSCVSSLKLHAITSRCPGDVRLCWSSHSRYEESVSSICGVYCFRWCVCGGVCVLEGHNHAPTPGSSVSNLMRGVSTTKVESYGTYVCSAVSEGWGLRLGWCRH